MMPQPNGASVPKFGSFKPRTSAGETASKTRSEDRVERKQRGLSKQNHPESEKEDSYRSRSKRRDDHDTHLSRSRSPLRTLQEPETLKWIMDIRGDPQNVQYGCPDRNKVSSYHRAGRGSVIGRPSYVKIDRSLSTQTQIVLQDTRRSGKAQRVLSSKSGDVSNKDMRVLSSGETETDSLHENYLEFAEEPEVDDEPKHSAVGVGIWKFIEADDESRP